MFKFYTEGHVILCSISAFLDPPHDEKVWTPAFHRQLMFFFNIFLKHTQMMKMQVPPILQAHILLQFKLHDPSLCLGGCCLKTENEPLDDQMFLNISETIWSQRVQTFSLPFKKQTWETELAV